MAIRYHETQMNVWMTILDPIVSKIKKNNSIRRVRRSCEAGYEKKIWRLDNILVRMSRALRNKKSMCELTLFFLCCTRSALWQSNCSSAVGIILMSLTPLPPWGARPQRAGLNTGSVGAQYTMVFPITISGCAKPYVGSIWYHYSVHNSSNMSLAPPLLGMWHPPSTLYVPPPSYPRIKP